MTTGIPVLEEQLDIHTRSVESAQVRIHTIVKAHEEQVEMMLQREDVEIERISVNREVAERQPVRYEGDVTIVSLHAQVVATRLVVTDELHIRKRTSAIQLREPVTLLREDVEVTRQPGLAAPPQCAQSHPPTAQ